MSDVRDQTASASVASWSNSISVIPHLTSVIRHLSHVVQQRKWTSTNESVQANRAISTGKLNALPRLHTRPINVVVYHGS